jgi:hypothetical protein
VRRAYGVVRLDQTYPTKITAVHSAAAKSMTHTHYWASTLHIQSLHTPITDAKAPAVSNDVLDRGLCVHPGNR